MSRGEFPVRAGRAVLAAAVLGVCGGAAAMAAPPDETGRAFDPLRDLLALHYDHAPDKDDGHSAVADRTLLQGIYGLAWIADHVCPVSGAYGKNAGSFNPASDAVMEAAWHDGGGWRAGHARREAVVGEVAARWFGTLAAGGDVWVKEGGQSDITAAVVARIRGQHPEVDTRARIHVVQHSTWNEEQTSESALTFTRQHTDYRRIRDANAYLNVAGGNDAFARAARTHPVFGPAWRAAFAYYDPRERLDFSDTGELLHILGLGEMGIDAFRQRFLDPADQGGRT